MVRDAVVPHCRRKGYLLPVLIGMLVFAILTVGKHFLNQIDLYFYNTYNGPEARVAADAKSSNLLVCRFKIEPLELVCGDKEYEFKEAWLEAAYEPRHYLVWFSFRRRADWSYLCVRPTTPWFNEDFSYRVVPEYKRGFDLSGLGSKGESFTQSGNDLYFQKVPTDLKELDLVVSVHTYEKGKDIVVGKSHLKRID
jgi:hypothetical protein